MQKPHDGPGQTDHFINTSFSFHKIDCVTPKVQFTPPTSWTMDPAFNPFALLQSTPTENPEVAKGQGAEVTPEIDTCSGDQGQGVQGEDAEVSGQVATSEVQQIQDVDRMIQTVFLVTVDHGKIHDK